MAPPKLLLPFADYCRMFRVMYSVLDERAHAERACIFFAVAGTLLLRRHYKLNALPVAGAAAYMVRADKGLIATFGKREDDRLIATPEAFHCWVECDGYAIDFMAPIFQENLAAAGIQDAIPRRMFQRRVAERTTSPADLAEDGAFSLFPDQKRTMEVMANFDARSTSGDLANLCAHWYRRPPKHISPTLDMANDAGDVRRLTLHGPEISGVW